LFSVVLYRCGGLDLRFATLGKEVEDLRLAGRGT
jgi:hypothetical protein